MFTQKENQRMKSLLFLMLFLFCFIFPSGFAEELVGNDQLYAIIGGKAHDIMQEQLTRLQSILEGFLVGDWAKIQRALANMEHDINTLSGKYTPPAGNPIPMLAALEQIKKHAVLLQSETAGQDYEKSFIHFTAITYQCIQCHQARRNYGTFKEGEKTGLMDGMSGGGTKVVKSRTRTTSNEPEEAVVEASYSE